VREEAVVEGMDMKRRCTNRERRKMMKVK